MRSRLGLLMNDGKLMMPNLDFGNCLRASSTNVPSYLSYMLNERNDNFETSGIVIDAWTYTDLKEGDTDLNGQEAVTEGWISASVGGGGYQSLPVSTTALRSNEKVAVTFKMEVPVSSTTEGDFYMLVELRYKGRRTKKFQRVADTSNGYKYGGYKYGRAKYV